MTPALELTRRDTNLRIRPFQESDALPICSWVTSQAKLKMVSGDIAECLTPEILRSWLARASASIVLEEIGTAKPIGFCTLSRLELPTIPHDYIEMCHVLVDPAQKYVFITSRLLNSAKVWASSMGYHFGCARVVPSNRWALLLAKYEKAEEFTGKESWVPVGFRWFRLELLP